MKRILAIVTLGVLLLATIGAATSAAALPSSRTPPPPVYTFKVTSDTGTFAGMLTVTTVNGVVPTYSFHGSTRLTPGTPYYLYYTTQTGGHDVGSAVANQHGIVSMNGVWQNPVADLKAHPSFTLSTQAPNFGGPGVYDVSVGENVVWGDAVPYNFHQAYAEGTNTHAESSIGNALSTMVAVPAGAHSEYSYARLGVVFHVKGVTTQEQWNAIKDRPVKFGANVAYTASATGDATKGSRFTFISLTGGSGTDKPGAIILDQRDTGTWTGDSAPVVTTTLGALDAHDGTPGDCTVVVNVWCGVFNSAAVGAEHHNDATISDIQLTWL